MKKFFTLIAAVAMAASVNAQGTYAVAENETPASGSKITSVPNVTLTYGTDTYSKGKKTANWVVEDFGYYTVGTANGKLVSGAAPTGCVYTFETKNSGSLTVGVQLSPNKGLHVLNSKFEEVDLAGYNFPASADATESQVLTTNAKNETIIPADGIKSNGTITINVAAGGTYYVLAAGTRLGFFGFKFTTGTSGISNINASEAANEGATFNLLGQKVASNAKGLVIKNGKKFINK